MKNNVLIADDTSVLSRLSAAMKLEARLDKDSVKVISHQPEVKAPSLVASLAALAALGITHMNGQSTQTDYTHTSTCPEVDAKIAAAKEVNDKVRLQKAEEKRQRKLMRKNSL